MSYRASASIVAHQDYFRADRDPVMDAARDFVMDEFNADEIAGALMNDGDCPAELWRGWQRRIRGAVAEKMEGTVGR